jgi:outer membrane protein assembly factor BamA
MPIVRRLDITGIRVTARNVVLREVKTRTGKPLDIHRLLLDMHALQNTGLFSQISYKLDPLTGDSVNVSILVREKDYGAYSLGLAYDETYQFRFGAEVAQENLLGSGAGVGAGFVLGNPREAWARYSGTRFFGLPFNYRLEGFSLAANYQPTVFLNDRDTSRIIYGLSEIGADLKLGVNIGRTAYAKGGFEIRGVTLEPVPESAFGRTREQLTAATFEFKTRTYSDLSFPYHGLSLQLLGKYGLKPLGSQFGFFKGELRAAAPLQLGSRAVFEPTLSAGVMRSGSFRTIAVESLPVAERFRVGGPDLAGALPDAFLTSQKVTAGIGVKYLLVRLFHSDDYPLYVQVEGDVAQFQQLNQLSLKSIYYGGYGGVTLSTPFGPLCAGFGIGRGGRNTIHVSAGYNLLQDLPR